MNRFFGSSGLFSSASLSVPCLFIHSGLCEKTSDIKILNSGTYIIKKRCHCGSQEAPDVQFCDFCGLTLNHHQARVENRTIEGCKNWCDLHALGGDGWCAKTFSRSPACTTICLGAVWGLQKGYHWCCSEGAFYEKCVKPFADILSHIPSRCEPEWD